MATWNRVLAGIGFLNDTGIQEWARNIVETERWERDISASIPSKSRLSLIQTFMMDRIQLTFDRGPITEIQEKEIGLILESLLFEEANEMTSHYVYQLISMMYEKKWLSEANLEVIADSDRPFAGYRMNSIALVCDVAGFTPENFRLIHGIKNPTLATDLFGSMLTALEGDEKIAEKTQKLLKNMNALTASQYWNMVLDEDMQDPAFWNFIIENVGTNNLVVYQHIQLLANADYQDAREALPGIVYERLVEYMTHWASVIESRERYDEFNRYLSSIKDNGTIPGLVYWPMHDNVAADFHANYGDAFDSLLQTAPHTKVDISGDLKQLTNALKDSPYYQTLDAVDAYNAANTVNPSANAIRISRPGCN